MQLNDKLVGCWSTALFLEGTHEGIWGGASRYQWHRCMLDCTPIAPTKSPKLPLATTLEGSGHSLNQEKAQAANIKCHKAAYGSICPEVEAGIVSDSLPSANKCRRGEHITVLSRAAALWISGIMSGSDAWWKWRALVLGHQSATDTLAAFRAVWRTE